MSKKDIELVIDASVASSAGTTDHPVSKACRDTLGCVQNHQYIEFVSSSFAHALMWARYEMWCGLIHPLTKITCLSG